MEDSVLFTDVAREMGEGGAEASLYTSSPLHPSPHLGESVRRPRAWEIQGIPCLTPTCHGRGASVSLSVWQLSDSMTHSLPASRCFLSNTQAPTLSHSLDAPVPPVSHNPDRLQSSHAQKYFLQTGARPLGRKP